MKRRNILLTIFCLSLVLVLVPELAKAKPAHAGDTIPPSVSITNPLSGTEVALNQSMTLQAVASDNRKVAKVEFYDNGVLKATDTRKPYSYVWYANSIGTHAWTAKAYDSSGNSTLSSTVTLTVANVSDTTPPSVPSGLTAAAASCSQVNLGWSPSTDTGGSGLRGYNVYRNGTYLKQVTTTSTSDTGLAASTSYSYAVSAVDNAGNQSA